MENSIDIFLTELYNEETVTVQVLNSYKRRKGVMTMPLQQEKTYTVADIYELPDKERAELIDGRIYYMSTPSRIHQKILHFLDKTIGNYIDEKGGSCEVYPAPFAVFLNRDDVNYVEPDISVICDMEKLDDKGCQGAPDWVIEISSPGSRRMDYMIKLFKYRSAGVREYWIVDPADQTVSVYNFEKDDMQKSTFEDIIKAGIYEDLEIDFSNII
jgi:Uma2 family endonuclease